MLHIAYIEFSKEDKDFSEYPERLVLRGQAFNLSPYIEIKKVAEEDDKVPGQADTFDVVERKNVQDPSFFGKNISALSVVLGKNGDGKTALLRALAFHRHLHDPSIRWMMAFLPKGEKHGNEAGPMLLFYGPSLLLKDSKDPKFNFHNIEIAKRRFQIGDGSGSGSELNTVYFSHSTRIWEWPLVGNSFQDRAVNYSIHAGYDISDAGLFSQVRDPDFNTIPDEHLRNYRALRIALFEMRLTYLSTNKLESHQKGQKKHVGRYGAVIDFSNKDYHWAIGEIRKVQSNHLFYQHARIIVETLGRIHNSTQMNHESAKFCLQKDLVAFSIGFHFSLTLIHLFGNGLTKDEYATNLLHPIELLKNFDFTSKLKSATSIDDLIKLIELPKSWFETIHDNFKTQNYPVDYIKSTIIAFDDIKKIMFALDPIDLAKNNNRYAIISSEENKLRIKTLFTTVSESIYAKHFLHFGWEGLSSGELASLELNSRLQWVRHNLNRADNGKSILICLDEADTFMHPEWQRTFLKDLLKFVETTFEGYHVQLVISTHSPFLLSDVPKENVLFLGDKRPKDPTFGANIHQLLSQDMFMQDTMGAFASSKIEKAIELLEGEDWNEEMEAEVKGIIRILGEPLIRKELERLLHYRLTSDELRKLKERVQRLEGNEGNSGGQD